MAIILGIESSCDDTAAAICVDGKIRANVVSAQLRHAEHGGVIPELASRMHQVHIGAVVRQALADAGLQLDDLNGIAYTAGPGLMGALLVGSSFAKGMALGLGLPLLAVNHLQGHVVSLFLAEPPPTLPMMALTVSGGHTQLQLVTDHLHYQVVGRTVDDAAGEAFDKLAKLLGFAYPGGPLVDKNAKNGDPHFKKFPTPKMDGLDFSFSGLKTAFLYYIQAEQRQNPQFVQQHLPDLCASIQHTIVSALLDKLFAACQQYGVGTAGIAGGVSANSALRAQFAQRCSQAGIQGHIPAFEYCTDNAAMIALAGYYLFQRGQFADAYDVPFASSRSSAIY